jgi:ABC-type dipeptide/oligopeptide/nickel transport system permease subunit
MATTGVGETLPRRLTVPSAPPQKVRSLWRDALKRLLSNRLSMVGLLVTLFYVWLAIFGPILAPYPYQQQSLLKTNQLPSQQHPLGTDDLGRDMLSRIMWGARTAMLVALVVTGISVTLGVVLGGISAYSGKWADWTVGRLIDVTQSIPTIMLAILVDATLQKWVSNSFRSIYDATGIEFFRGSLIINYLVTMSAIALVSWPGYARLIRAQILSLRERDFVEAARSVGASRNRILARHIVPNALGPIIVAATFGFSSAMILEASLSYLGLGIQPPAASWGAMISDNMHQWRIRPYLVFIPALILGIATLAINFLGDGLSDALNPRSRGMGKK